MTLDMMRIRIIGMRPDLRNIIFVLGRLGLVQIDGVAETSDIALQQLVLDVGQQREQQKLGGMLSKLEGFQHTLECEPTTLPEHYPKDFLTEAEKGIQEISPQIEEISTRRETLEAARSTLPRYEMTLKKLIPDIPLSARDKNNQTTAVIVNQKNLDVLEILRSQLSEMTEGHVEIIKRRIDEDTQGMLIIFPRRFSEQVRNLLGEKDVTRFQLPDEFARDTPEKILSALQQRIKEIPREIQELDDEIKHLGDIWCDRINLWTAALQEDMKMYEMFLRLGQTDRTIIIHGWTPPKNLPKLKKALAKEIGQHVSVEELPITDEIRDQAPIVLENPKAVQPFESLIHLVASPNYNGMDPTWMIAIFFPIIFGMMLGDAGYGAILLIVCLALMRRFKSGFTADLLKILAYGSGWSIVFGILYGELFGRLGEQLGMQPIWFHRAGEDVTSMLILSLGMGAAHITLGLILGIWTAIQEKSRSHLLERGGMLIGLTAVLVVVGVMTGYLPDGLMNPAIAGIIVGVVVLGSSMGWLGILIGPIEFISLIGNVLSYLRIAAIGLASVYLAEVANELGGALGSAIVGVIIAVLIHGLNIVLGAFSPTIHSLRLHYVEFFRKFYEGGGRRFEPYKSKLTS